MEKDPEILDIDLVCIKPDIKDLKLREMAEMDPAPGILYSLFQEPKTVDEIAEETNYERDFIEEVLKDSEKDGWVETTEEESWRLKNYRAPSKECVLVNCGSSIEKLSKTIKKVEGNYNKFYQVYPNLVTDSTKDFFKERGIGILVFFKKIGYFEEVVSPQSKKITDKKTHLSVTEEVLRENHHRYND